MSRRGWLILKAAVWLGPTFLWAGGFQQAYDAALTNDATFRAARQELVATQHGVAIARSNLLPSVSLSISSSRVLGSRTVDNFLGQPVTSDLDYRSPQQTLSLRAPLVNIEATQRYRQAQAQVELAKTMFLARGYEMLDRLVQAYLQRLFADANLQVAQAQVKAAQERRQLAARRMELGEGTRPEVLTADADLALALAQRGEADNQVNVVALALEQITGLHKSAMQALPDAAAPSAMPEVASLQEWLDRADAANPALLARRHALALARIAVSRAEAGHYPRVDLVASASSSRNDSVSTLNQAVRQRAIGVQINLPIYSGGGVVASVLQALAEQEKAQAELEAEQLGVVSELQRLYLALNSASARIGALQKALEAGQLALEGARRGVLGGVRIQADVEQAQQKVVEARRDLAKARYEQVLNQMRLYSRAGIPAPEIAQRLDRIFSAPAQATLP